MSRKKIRYLGNPEFEHLHIHDELETKEVCRQHEHTSEGPSYQVEGEAPPLRTAGGALVKVEDVGAEEDEDFAAGTSDAQRTGDGAKEHNELLQRLQGPRRSGGGSPSSSRRSMTSLSSPPPRELRVRLTKNLSTRTHSVRRFVDFTISNYDGSQRMFQAIKNEQDVCNLKNGDLLLRLRLTFNTKRNPDDPYVKDYVAEIKFRGRLSRYVEERDAFEELAVVSQCMAIMASTECRRSPPENHITNPP